MYEFFEQISKIRRFLEIIFTGLQWNTKVLGLIFYFSPNNAFRNRFPELKNDDSSSLWWTLYIAHQRSTSAWLSPQSYRAIHIPSLNCPCQADDDSIYCFLNTLFKSTCKTVSQFPFIDLQGPPTWLTGINYTDILSISIGSRHHF